MQSAPYCADSEFFAGECERWEPQREAIRRDLGIQGGEMVLVFAGKLIPKKDPLLITAALALLSLEQRAHLHLLVAGDGELRCAMERAGGGVLGPRCHLLGFQNHTQIGRVYAAGDVLVLLSRRGAGETWGLVVNEAMQFGLAPVVSDGVGCAPDLLALGMGAVFRSADAPGLAAELTKLLATSPTEWARIRSAAKIRVGHFSAEIAAERIAAVAKQVTKNTCQ